MDDPKRKSRWRAKKLGAQGKLITRFFKTEKEAKAFLREVNADEKKLKALTESGVTFNTFSQVFLEDKKKENLKPTAYRSLKDHVNRVSNYVGKMMLRDIDSEVVQKIIFDLAEKGYSESVMTKAKNTTIAVLKMAASRHFLDTLPIFDITIPRQPKQDTERLAKNNWMRDDELALYEAECRKTYVPKKYTKYAGETLLVHVAGYKMLFILHTGLRLGEALALTWADYDERSKTILINKKWVLVEK